MVLTSNPSTPEPSQVEDQDQVDDFRPPTPPRNPIDCEKKDGITSPRKKSIFEGTDYRIPRYEPPLPPFLAPVSKPLKISGVQRHIQKTVQRKETQKIRRSYNKTVNKPWSCKICNVYCCNKSVKDAHLNSRKHIRASENEPQHCDICKFTAFSSEDFARHLNGKRHKKQIQNRVNRL